MNRYFPMSCMSALLIGTASALTVETLPTQGVFYAGLSGQPCLQLKVAATAGESISGLIFNTAKSTNSTDITKATLYRSPSDVFTVSSSNTALKATKLAECTTAATGTMVFVTDCSLQEGDNYLWLVYDIAASAKGNNKIQAQCASVTDGAGHIVQPTAEVADSKAVVYPFKYRVVPYYRPHWLSWNPNQLNATHFKNLTDIILFELSYGSDGSVSYQYSKSNFDSALSKFKSLRGKSASRIIAGFKAGAGLENVLSDETKRNKLADGLAAIVRDNGMDGLDLDWEYPSSGSLGKDTNWVNFAKLLARIREQLAGTGASLSICYDTFCFPPAHVWEQADWISSMTYDRYPGQHSTKQHAIDDCSAAINNGVPRVKYVLGLPFYSCNTENPRDWNTQRGYTTIVNSCPKLNAATNTFTDPSSGQNHFFNGANLIKDKCKYAIAQKIGGVMVWAFDTDVPLSNSKSLSKALYSVIKQTKR